ncbi:hypothetical protein P692DRAFT_20860400 [Suillus brevipes Sb2]|nr:hypothetical protein P692DRAFT_20860400 [Suillus brevipes Sb2]
MYLNVDKELPPLPGRVSSPAGARPIPLAPSFDGGRIDMESPHQTLVLEKFPSPAELAIISSWHDATIERRVRFQRNPAPDGYLRSFPPPVSKGDILAHSTSCGNDATPQRERGLFTRKQPVDSQKLEDRVSRPTRSQKFLDIGKAARSTPNLNAATKAGAHMISRSVRFAPCEAIASTPAPKRPIYAPLNQLASTSTRSHPTDAPVDELDEASQALGIDVNDGNIYLTLDPDCRSSRGEAVLTFLSPIPNEISNSTLIPRHRTLSEVPMPRDTSTRPRI